MYLTLGLVLLAVTLVLVYRLVKQAVKVIFYSTVACTTFIVLAIVLINFRMGL